MIGSSVLLVCKVYNCFLVACLEDVFDFAKPAFLLANQMQSVSSGFLLHSLGHVWYLAKVLVVQRS
jgi:hypothetical protein